MRRVVPLDEAGIKLEPRKIAGTALLFDETGAQSKKVSDALASPMCWVHCVRVLCYTYALVSAGGEPENEWCSLEWALHHLAVVESFARMDSKSGASPQQHLVEAEVTVRHEWHRLTQADSSISLHDAIELSAKSQIWPMKHQFLTSNAGVPGRNRGRNGGVCPPPPSL